jgi:hypothetical protein
MEQMVKTEMVWKVMDNISLKNVRSKLLSVVTGTVANMDYGRKRR